ncbi:MAG: D-glycerate dehydrogenase, partial [Myxococcales bacterium]|nr:D-glycerate dehydrogenase [Myxococcales bacterium]
MPKPKVLVTRVPPGSALERLREECDVWMWEEDTAMPRDLLLEKVRDAEGLHCIFLDGVNEELLAAAPRLRAVSTYAAGMENIDLGACTTRGIPVGYTPGAVTEATADIAFGLMLAASRRLMEASRYVTAGKWRDWS